MMNIMNKYNNFVYLTISLMTLMQNKIDSILTRVLRYNSRVFS